MYTAGNTQQSHWRRPSVISLQLVPHVDIITLVIISIIIIISNIGSSILNSLAFTDREWIRYLIGQVSLNQPQAWKSTHNIFILFPCLTDIWELTKETAHRPMQTYAPDKIRSNTIYSFSTKFRDALHKSSFLTMRKIMWL